MRVRFLVILQMAALMALSRASYGQSKGYFAEPGSTLLFSGQSATDFLLVTPTGNVTVPGPPGSLPELSSTLPVLAPAGDQVASGFRFPVDFVFVPCSKPGCAQPRSAKYKSVMGVYSLHDKAWKLYGDFCSVGSAAFSPDGKKVAFKVETRSDSPTCTYSPGSHKLLILDLESGQFTPVPGTELVENNAQLSWSPDGKYIAVEVLVAREDSELHMPYYKGPFQIVSIEIGSWAQKIIADGNGPSWSPKGEWIAYQAPLERCMVIHPDGTGAKMVLDPDRQRGVWSLYDAIVWSPDGESLLLNEEQSDTGHSNVTMLDLATGKLTRKSKNSPAVFGWAPAGGPGPITKN